MYRTNPRAAPAAAGSTRRAPSDRAIVVDQSSLLTAEQLVRMPTTSEERALAEDALRIADNEMDLAFASAVRRTANQPRATNDTAKEADARLQRALRALAADQAQVAALTAAVAKANVAQAEALNDKLDLAKAQAALDEDESDDARQDLRRAGGDPQGRMEDMIAEHDAASKSSDSVRVVVSNPDDARGLVRHLSALRALTQKDARLADARAQADSLAALFKERHDRVEARSAARSRDSTAGHLSHDSAAALLATTRSAALDGKIRASLDQRVDNQRRLSDVYASWSTVIRTQERAAVNRALRDLLMILAIVLVALLVARWIEHRIGAQAMRVQAIHMVVQVSLEVVAVVLIALVVFGPPDNLGTILGLAGAGLTVALKDFILGFFGWFVLVGRNGMRIGDLVEINGVTGEVVELGMFRTVLLETGDWTELGHPTGRRVTFNNSFAIERHFFNFSTSGRWLWDAVKIVVPAGRDPYPIAAALQQLVEDATKESALEAEAEWKGARRTAQVANPSAAAGVTLKPIGGGVEITVRYVTSVAEREALREKVYHMAVEMLGAVKT